LLPLEVTVTIARVLKRKRRQDAADVAPRLAWHIDEPAAGTAVGPGWFRLRGWVAVPQGSHVAGPELSLGGARIPLKEQSRPDVEAVYPDRRVIGTREFVRLRDDVSTQDSALMMTVDGEEHRLPLSVTTADSGAMPFEWCLDSPRDGATPAWHSVLVSGWVIVPRDAVVESVFVDCGTRIPLNREERPDLQANHPDDQIVGFRDLVALTPSTPSEPWFVGLGIDSHEFRMPLSVAVATADRDELFRRKAAKLRRIESVLRCPRPLRDAPEARACGGKLDRDAEVMLCVECGRRYPITGRNFNFLDDELRELSGIVDTANVSSLPYTDWEFPELIEEHADGLILDNGSGLRDVYYENVVNLEIVDYLTTDVLGVGEYLPFADDSFDAVISIAVLEHVRNPFRCAAEIARVVRPGGKVLVLVPFLQPYHGYPHHYYNMTRSGLENLFAEGFVIERAGVPPGGEPIFTLPWLLNSYVAGLPREAAERFKRLTVGDLLADASPSLEEDYVRELDARVAEELAHVTYVLATKRDSPGAAASHDALRETIL
jgi:SAM-dependent methyltransferase